MPGVVPAPPSRPPTISLLSAAVVIDAEADSRWENGYRFQPEACGSAGVEDPCASNLRIVSDRPSYVDADPFVVWAGDRCSTFGFNREEYAERARRLLINCQSAAIANELWTGTLSAAAGFDNQLLATPAADTVTPLGAAASPLAALACLEQGLAQAYCGRRGMIHATPAVATYWAAQQLVRREGGMLLTALDTIVVADAGYTGSSPTGVPAGADQWAYATGLVVVRLGPITITPEPGRFEQAVDRSIDDVEFLAWRPASVAWDGCALLAARVEVAACAIGGGS